MTSKSRLLSSVVNKSESLIGASLSNPNEVNLQSLETAATQYTDVTTLPASGYIGEQAFVASTNRLYIWTGTGWFNIALVNTDPTISSAGNANYTMSYGTPITVDVDASDPEGLGLSYSYYTSDSIGNIATITNDSSRFTITPSSDYSVEGSFGLVFRASDGPNIASSSSSSFTLTNQSPSLSGNSSSYVLAPDGSTPTVITLTSVDPEGQPITYTATGDSGFNAIATVSNDSSVFTITPKSEDSAVSGTGSLTFTASDGVKSTNAASSFTLSFISTITNSKYTTLLATATGTSDNSNITDASSNNHTITANGDAHAGTFSPHRSGGYSTSFSRSASSKLEIASMPAIGSGDCSIEFWCKIDSQAWNGIISRGAYNSSGTFSLSSRSGDTELTLIWSGTIYTTSGANIDVNQWKWVQIIRSSGTVTIYVNGSSVGSWSNSSNVSSTSNYIIGRVDSSDYFGGYLRDLRISTNAQSSSSVSEKLATDSNTTFLSCHLPYLSYSTSSVASNSYSSISGTIKTAPLSPYDYTEYSATNHGGSIFVDNLSSSTDSVSCTLGSAIGTGDFSISGWFYPPEVHGSGNKRIWTIGGNNNVNGLGLLFQTNGQIRLDFPGNTTSFGGSGGSIANRWQHFCVRRISGTATLHLDGVQKWTQSNNTINLSATNLEVGRDTSGLYGSHGYISDFKISTSSLEGTTVPAAPTSSTGALVHIKGTDASIIDKSQSHNIDMIGNLAVNTSTVKFANTKSIYFDGGNSVLELPAPGILLPPQSSSNFSMDWTIEGWLYRTSAVGENGTVGDGIFTVNSYDEWDEYPANSNINGLSFSTKGLSIGQNSSTIGFSTQFTADNQWHHFALVRYHDVSAVSTYVNVYRDGTSVLQLQDAADGYLGFDNLNTPSAFGVFDKYNGSYRFYFQGYMQDLRISRRAVYTSAFTPPTAEFEG